ncbi:MAG TPA: hypothetical protein VMN03_10020 [Burkholderiales bacterium]|nr:hypothetical protein [Burkholderiales bacterium]
MKIIGDSNDRVFIDEFMQPEHNGRIGIPSIATPIEAQKIAGTGIGEWHEPWL